jgi:hypothetical protein
MNALKETENMSRQLFIEWHPVIMYNHHQTGPQGAVMFAPPFRDPANYNFHPLIITQLDVVGSPPVGARVRDRSPRGRS